MFDIAERRSLTSVLSPPKGYELEAAILTTYSLDFVALTAALGALANVRSFASVEPAPRDVLRALLRTRDRICVFSHQAQIQRPSAGGPRRLYGLYDACSRVVTSTGHAFHPKVYLIKYSSTPGSADIYRFVCASRNLTRAQTIECAVILEGRIGRGRSRFAVELGRFLRELAGIGRQIPSAVRTLIDQVPALTFVPPAKTQSVTFCGQSAQSASLVDRLPTGTKYKNVLLISPFVGAGFLNRVLPRSGRATVISRQQELDCLSNDSWASVRDRAEWFVANSVASDGDASMELHAKMLMFDDGPRHRVLLGSANATAAAWGLRRETSEKNWEAMVSLEGGAFRTQFEKNVLRPTRRGEQVWLQPYLRRQFRSDRWKDTVEEAQRILAQVELLAAYKERSSVLSVRVTKGRETLVSVDLNVRIAPMALDHLPAMYRDLTAAERKAVAFDGVMRSDVSQFFTIELSKSGEKRRHCFTVRAAASWSQAFLRKRDTAAVQESAGAMDVIDLLLERLGVIKSSRSGDGGERKKKRARARQRSPSRGLLEAVLRTWVTNPSELESVYADLGQFVGDQSTARRLRELIDTIRKSPRVGSSR